jgi:DNA-binding GntR family transcriptional regulator
MPRPSLSPQISARIVDYIRENRLSAGHHLPAQALAEAFKVSRAPINAALRELEKAKIVRSEPNRGFFVAKASSALPKPRRSGSLAGEIEDELYVRIADDRLAGRLQHRTSEAELMRIYEVPRNRLLKILYRVAEEGWIERLPGNGWEFKPILTSRTSYEQSYQFRASIECEALRLQTFVIDQGAFRTARKEQTAILEGGYRTMTRTQLFRANSEFHEMLAGCSRNEFFLDSLKRVNRLRRLVEFRITVDRSRLPQQTREHLELLDLIEAGKREKAVKFLRQHILGASAIKSPQLAI